MRRASSILVLFVLLAFGLSLAVPAEDVPETGYDESEEAPYENTPLISIVLLRLSAPPIEVLPSSLRLKIGAPSLFAPAHIRDADVHRTAGARALSALLCILLC